MQLSHSRFDVVVWSERKDQLAWLHCHGEALKRIGGVPATVRIDNEKTAIATGAGAWGEVHIAYRRFAEVARFPVDACAPRSPEAKGKVERRIRDHRLQADPRSRTWTDLAELQEWTDERLLLSAHRRRCPVTGTSVFDAWRAERAHLGEATEEVLAPTPLGRMGRRLQEIALLAPERRPLDLYAALAEVAR